MMSLMTQIVYYIFVLMASSAIAFSISLLCIQHQSQKLSLSPLLTPSGYSFVANPPIISQTYAYPNTEGDYYPQ